MPDANRAGFAIIGAGIAGVATAYYLCTRFGKGSVLLIDPRQPLSYTSAQSGDNYRNWWPHPTMTRFTDHSISLMEEIALQTGNGFGMTRAGYVLATRSRTIDDLVSSLHASYSEQGSGEVRLHGAAGSRYDPSPGRGWQAAPGGVDVLSGKRRLRAAFPSLAADIRHVIHIRRAGDIDSQRLGRYMLERIRDSGGRCLRGEVEGVSRDRAFVMDVMTARGLETVTADVLIDAAGPFAGRIAGMLGVELPLRNVFQQKIAFADRLSAIPRDLPFVIDLDPLTLDWPADVHEMLADDRDFAWLTRQMPGGRHCRPDGGPESRRVKLGWAYNRAPAEPRADLADPSGEPGLDDAFPEIVIRAAARLLPGLRPYVDAPPPGFAHYGGYYTMTEENWPLIGPLGGDGAYIAAALSGFGSMAACAAGFTCASWACGAPLPDYARELSLERCADDVMIRALRTASKGLL